MYDHILAKSAKSGVTLPAHTRDVVESVRGLFGTEREPSRLSTCWLRFFRLRAADFKCFFRNTVAAAAFHDWGKANNGFQDAVRYQGQQIIRHEHLSTLMLAVDEVADWLSKAPAYDQDVILSAVLSHHLKAKRDSLAVRPPESTLVELQTRHEEFEELLSYSADELAIPGPHPIFKNPFWDYCSKPPRFDLDQHRSHVQKRLNRFGRVLRKDQRRRQMLYAVRSALIAADAVGSARYRIGLRPQDWLEKVLDPHKVCTGELIMQSVIGNRITAIERQGKAFAWNQFQDECAALPPRALLLAPCGSGKTLAAWRWVAARCQQNPVKRVLFLYPTRATATEGFRDYVSWAPEADAALMHGTASYDLLGMFENGDEPDSRGDKDYTVQQRLFALGFWSKQIFSATVDQFFGFLQYSYGSMCVLPLLADSVVVVDEVHSFDRGMFSALKEFLATFDVPVLCMTATLPNVRRDELAASGLEVYSDKKAELKDISDAPRYRVRRIEEAEVDGRIQQALAAGKRVLWVVNKVRRAQDAAIRFAKNLDGEVLSLPDGGQLICYHSRFRLMDRKLRHEEVVRAFQAGGSERVLAITTQVCEMSLDMDADILVTERAPITSLIQRMGRCNRARVPRKNAGDVLVYTPSGGQKPYDEKSLLGVDEFLDTICEIPAVSQTHLEETLAQAPWLPELPKDCHFVSSGPYASSTEESFRDIEEFTLPAVLLSDLGKFLDLVKQKRPTDGLHVPVPKHFKFQLDRQPPGFPDWLTLAPAQYYHPSLGFYDEPLLKLGALIT